MEHVAPVLARACATCHAAPTAVPERRNCIRTDRWDAAADSTGLCNDPAMAGMIFGVGDAAPIIVDAVVSGQMPQTGALGARDIELFRRWGAAGHPKRAVNQPPTIRFVTPPAGGATLCGEDDCRYAVSYVVEDGDGDSVRWSLGWSGAGGGGSGVFADGLTAGAGSVMIDAAMLAGGTYTLTAILDDGTAETTSAAPGALTVSPGHDPDPGPSVSFAQQIQPIFNASCVDAQCHAASQSLPLTAGLSYRALVGVASREDPCTSYQRVAPGQPDQSFLVFKLDGAGPCFAGSQMPRGRAPLSPAQRQLFRDWIAAGAPNN